MKQREKYLSSLPRKQQQHLLKILELLVGKKRASLDIKQLQGITNTFRYRVRDLRIIFSVKENTIIINYIGPRGDIYK